MTTWPLSIGQRIKRVDLHRQFGGSRQAGISPSARTPNLFLFTEGVLAEQRGYVESWNEDGCFHFSGEGQRGDQRLVRGNLAILDSCRVRRALRVFKGVGWLRRVSGSVCPGSGSVFFPGRRARDIRWSVTLNSYLQAAAH